MGAVSSHRKDNKMIIKENFCVGCETCMNCGRREDVEILVCDNCGDDENLYAIGDEVLCIDCLKKDKEFLEELFDMYAEDYLIRYYKKARLEDFKND